MDAAPAPEADGAAHTSSAAKSIFSCTVLLLCIYMFNVIRRQRNVDFARKELMTRLHLIDDSNWDEVREINYYTVFMAHLLMGVRGLGLLVLTWITVVLLGGFVSDLLKEDFWSLTTITLIQIAGVFDFLLNERWADIQSSLEGFFVNGYIQSSLEGFFITGYTMLLGQFREATDTSVSSKSKVKEHNDLSTAGAIVAIVLWNIQHLVLLIILYPLTVLYVFGMYISTGISLWRLVEHHYGDKDGDVNLKPALNLLYFLAVAQGVVFGFKAMFDWGARTRLAAEVASDYSLDIDIVSNYLDETLMGCTKDTSFARGRNLITYAVDLLMESNLRHRYLSGVLILGTIIQRRDEFGQPILVKRLLTGSASFSHVVQLLLETFGPRSPYSTEIREHAARIVANVAGSIRLEQFPAIMTLECISSLLEYNWWPEGYEQDSHPLPKVYERGWLLEREELQFLFLHPPTPKAALTLSVTPESDSNNPLGGCKGLMLQGLIILQKLTVSEDNCRVIISKAEGLLSKTMAPLIQDQLHRDHHHEWSSIAEESLELIRRLMAAPGEIGKQLRRQILINKEVIISTLRCILGCPKCEVLLKRQAVQVLLDLSVDTLSIIMPSRSSCRIFNWILLHIFLLEDIYFFKMCGALHWAKKSSEIRKLAGEKLSESLSSQGEGSSTNTTMLKSVSDAVGDLSSAIVDDVDRTYRFHALHILDDMCRYHSSKNDVYLQELKKAIADVMPKVLKEILDCGPAGEEIHAATTTANNIQDSAALPGADVEQGGHVQQNTSSFQHRNGEQHDGRKLQKAMMSMCLAINRHWIDVDKDFTRQLNMIAAETCLEQGLPVKTFRRLVCNAADLLDKEEEEEKAQRLANVATTSSET